MILLSLVRSNEHGKIGFLNVAGRICVALSRARVGLFIVGNVDELSRKSGIWSSIKRVLESDDSIGESMELVCPFHCTSRQTISASDEMSLENRFCDEICDAALPRCGHKCLFSCHFDDRNHVDAKKCRQPCQRCCSEGHPCLKKCDEICSPCEWVDSENTILKCGHKVFAKCRTVFETSPCQASSVVKTLSCGHEKVTSCSSTSTECDVSCDVILNCGHSCDVLCGQHEKGRHNVRCSKTCNRSKLGCRAPEIHPRCNKVLILSFSFGVSRQSAQRCFTQWDK